ncbi:MAG: methyltransferase domain-containing protein [Acidimicrobiales bacterium]
MTISLHCPVCDGERWEPVLRLPAVPVAVGSLMSPRAVAVEAARGDIDLCVCGGCGLVRNLAFDPTAVDYAGDYESSQFCSATFAEYARDLVARLVDRYGLAGGTVVDIGCGQGELLELFLQAGVRHGIGVDPGYTGERAELERSGRLRVIRDPYLGQLADVGAGLWCCRHVLEHVTDPAGLLTSIRDDAGRGTVYVEVPNGEFVLGDAGLWDVIYPHVSYFTASALRTMVERCGLDVLDARSDFGGQFLGVEAAPADRRNVTAATPEARSGRMRISAVAQRFERIIHRWNTLISERDRYGTTVVWGAGSKSVTFLNSTVAGEIVDVVVDLNPRKHGSFIPGTGQEVIGPEALRELRPATVVVMNANYEPEIRAQLGELGLDPQVLCA